MVFKEENLSEMGFDIIAPWSLASLPLNSFPSGSCPFSLSRFSSVSSRVSLFSRSHSFFSFRSDKMFDDQDLGFFSNFLGIFIFVLVIAYHYVMADPKYEGN